MAGTWLLRLLWDAHEEFAVGQERALPPGSPLSQGEAADVTDRSGKPSATATWRPLIAIRRSTHLSSAVRDDGRAHRESDARQSKSAKCPLG